MKYFFGFLFLMQAFGIFAQENQTQLERVNFKTIDAQIKILPRQAIVTGSVIYNFEVLQPVDSLYIDAENMQFKQVSVNGTPVKTRNSGKQLWLVKSLQPSKNNSISLQYTARPEKALYFINWQQPDSLAVNRQVWSQGQGKYTSNWLPSFDDMNEKTIFNLSFDFNSDYRLISNGKLKDKIKINDSINRWTYSMDHPMSSYLVAVAAGKFSEKKMTSNSGVPISLYTYSQDSLHFEATYSYSKKIFDFLEKEIGLAFPWQNYKQVPVQDFLYAGMENTTVNIFSNSLQTDSIGFKDRNFVNVNAHELAHQWFGDMVTETESKNHWLQEGFATYYALLAEKEIFGQDYYYWKLYESAEQLKKMSDSGKGESLLNPNASSLTFYQKGAWALHILREQLGDEAFRKGIQNYLKLYKFQNVTTANFIAEMEKASGQDLSNFIERWLKQSAFKAREALNSLKKSEFIKSYLKIAALRETPFSQKQETLSKALNFPVNEYIGQEVVLQLATYNSPAAVELLKKAFATNNIFVRQAIATNVNTIPQELQANYESLLEDPSYLTQEAALLNLWMQFPNKRSIYLKKMQGVSGFFNKNVRMLWLSLNLATPNFDRKNQQPVYNELSGYTNSYYPQEIRENAFGYLYQIDSFTSKNLKDVMQGTQHFNYRFRDFCRQLLAKLLQNDQYWQRFNKLLPELPQKQKDFLLQKLKKQ